jgi:2-polyprenyl-3-methyl-5-hydroxy-6-metoxy-1,4-benzoquinol methylase
MTTQITTVVEHTAALYDYISSHEATRLDMHPIEREVTLRTITRYLLACGDSTCRIRIADIGGATGGYAFPLAARGHEVHLVDLAPKLIDIARSTDSGKPEGAKLASIRVGSALDSELFTEADRKSFDAVLLLGPLYHIVSHEERRRALHHALDLVKGGGRGIVFAAFIPVQAHLRDLARKDPTRLLEHVGFYDRYVSQLHQLCANQRRWI